MGSNGAILVQNEMIMGNDSDGARWDEMEGNGSIWEVKDPFERDREPIRSSIRRI